MKRKRPGVPWYDFPPLTAVGIAASGFAARVLGAAVTYAQTGEDRILLALLALAGVDDSRGGFYVDVGANEPIKNSNTFMFYRRGWRGITIEAQPDLVEQHRRVRRRDRAVCAVVSDATEELTLREFANPGFATVEGDSPWIDRPGGHRDRRVTPRRLTDILEAEGAPEQFELLSVDVEGHDLHILRSLDFSLFRPLLVAVEIYGLRIADGGLERDASVEFLVSQGYEPVGYAVFNGYFVDRQTSRV